MKNKTIKLFLVDDDAVFLRMLKMEFNQHTEYTIETYATGESCLQRLSEEKPDLIILDYHLNGVDKTAMNGIQTLDEILRIDPSAAVVMLSSQDKIEVAVNCMHHKAFDYVVKNETAFHRLQRNIMSHLHRRRIENELSWYMSKMA